MLNLPQGTWIFAYNRLAQYGQSRFLRDTWLDFKDYVERHGSKMKGDPLPTWIVEPIASLPSDFCPDLGHLSMMMNHDYWILFPDRPQTWPGQPEITILATHNRLRSIMSGDLARDPSGNWHIATAMGWTGIELKD